MTKQKQTTVAVVITDEIFIEGVLRMLKCTLEKHQEDWQKGVEKLTQNAVQNMSWYAKDIYVGQYMQREYETIKTVFEENQNSLSENMLPALEELFRGYEYFLSKPFNIRARSTCEVTQMTSTWEYECQLTAKNYVKELMNNVMKQINKNSF